MKILPVIAALLVTGALTLHAQNEPKPKFNPNYAMQSLSAEYGVMASFNGGAMDSQYFQLTYSHKFWRHFSYRTGAMAVPRPGGFELLAGIPLGLSFSTGTASFEDAASYALHQSIYDVVAGTIWGDYGGISHNLVENLLLLLFRRFDFFVGITPGYYFGKPSTASNITIHNRYSLWVDAGMTLSIPIWRFTLNLSPVFHYACINNCEMDNQPTRTVMSFSGGISYLF